MPAVSHLLSSLMRDARGLNIMSFFDRQIRKGISHLEFRHFCPKPRQVLKLLLAPNESTPMSKSMSEQAGSAAEERTSALPSFLSGRGKGQREEMRVLLV